MSAAGERWKAAVRSIEDCVLCGKYGVQASHRNEGRGIGQKNADHLCSALCPECHHEIDNGKVLDQRERREQWNLAYVRTIDALVRNGKITVKS